MDLQERIYSILVVSASENFNNALSSLLPAGHFEPVRFVRGISAAKRMMSEHVFDLVVINAPLPDDMGTGFAIDACNTSGTIVLMIVHGDVLEGLSGKVTRNGCTYGITP